MRFPAILALAILTAVPIAAGIAPTVAHAFQKSKKGDAAKAERKRAEQEAIRAAVQRGEVLPLPRILAIAQAKVPGDIIKVELDYESTGIEYEVKILTPAGRVREVEINARTGAILRIEDK